MKIRELIEHLEKLEKDYDDIYAEDSYKFTAFQNDSTVYIKDIGNLFLVPKNKVITVNDLILTLAKIRDKDTPISILFNDGTKEIHGLIEDIKAFYVFPKYESSYAIKVRKGGYLNNDSEGTN